MACGRDAKAAAHIMHRQASIGPGLRRLLTSIPFFSRISTARSTWLFSNCWLLCVILFSKIKARIAVVHFVNSLYPTITVRFSCFSGRVFSNVGTIAKRRFGFAAISASTFSQSSLMLVATNANKTWVFVPVLTARTAV